MAEDAVAETIADTAHAEIDANGVVHVICGSRDNRITLGASGVLLDELVALVTREAVRLGLRTG